MPSVSALLMEAFVYSDPEVSLNSPASASRQRNHAANPHEADGRKQEAPEYIRGFLVPL
ncbi:hypothetical protein [Sphingobacterium thalpophilum]